MYAHLKSLANNSGGEQWKVHQLKSQKPIAHDT